MKDLVRLHQQKVETWDALLHRILDTETGVKDSPDELMQNTRSTHRRTRMWIEAEDGRVKHLL
jgi:hypothetical protein